MTGVIIYASVTKNGELIRVSGYITAESALHDLQWPLPSEPFEMWACKMSEAAASEIRAETDTKKAWRKCKLYSHYMQKCADVTGAGA